MAHEDTPERGHSEHFHVRLKCPEDRLVCQYTALEQV